MNPKMSNYILQKIGDFNNSTILKSKYVTVEVAEGDLRTAIPCGFTGLPVRNLGTIKKPALAYNTVWDEETQARRQYFGLSDKAGVDEDMLFYKGRSCYTDGTFTEGFHLDSRVGKNTTLDGNVLAID
jgi:hypothetical protein